MPIANCFLNDVFTDEINFKSMTEEWAKVLKINPEDITLNIFTDFEQFGNNFRVMVNLLLPSVWSETEIQRIQTSLSELFSKYLNIKPSEIFIMTSIVKTGHVTSNGKIEEW